MLVLILFIYPNYFFNNILMFLKTRIISFIKKIIKKSNFLRMNQNPTSDPPLKTIKEGKASLILSMIKTEKNGDKYESDVFYNPVQVYNRDLTILCLKFHAMELKEKDVNFSGLTIFDALSASGLRTIRFLKELEDSVKKVYANDISKTSQELMQKNFDLNELDLSKIVASRDDANKLLMEYREPFFKEKGKEYLKFDVIDLDPYGSCIPFIDAAVQCANANSIIVFF